MPTSAGSPNGGVYQGRVYPVVKGLRPGKLRRSETAGVLAKAASGTRPLYAVPERRRRHGSVRSTETSQQQVQAQTSSPPIWDIDPGRSPPRRQQASLLSLLTTPSPVAEVRGGALYAPESVASTAPHYGYTPLYGRLAGERTPGTVSPLAHRYHHSGVTTPGSTPGLGSTADPGGYLPPWALEAGGTPLSGAALYRNSSPGSVVSVGATSTTSQCIQVGGVDEGSQVGDDLVKVPQRKERREAATTDSATSPTHAVSTRVAGGTAAAANTATTATTTTATATTATATATSPVKRKVVSPNVSPRWRTSTSPEPAPPISSCEVCGSAKHHTLQCRKATVKAKAKTKAKTTTARTTPSVQGSLWSVSADTAAQDGFTTDHETTAAVSDNHRNLGSEVDTSADTTTAVQDDTVDDTADDVPDLPQDNNTTHNTSHNTSHNISHNTHNTTHDNTHAHETSTGVYEAASSFLLEEMVQTLATAEGLPAPTEAAHDNRLHASITTIPQGVPTPPLASLPAPPTPTPLSTYETSTPFESRVPMDSALFSDASDFAGDLRKVRELHALNDEWTRSIHSLGLSPRASPRMTPAAASPSLGTPRGTLPPPPHTIPTPATPTPSSAWLHRTSDHSPGPLFPASPSPSPGGSRPQVGRPFSISPLSVSPIQPQPTPRRVSIVSPQEAALGGLQRDDSFVVLEKAAGEEAAAEREVEELVQEEGVARGVCAGEEMVLRAELAAWCVRVVGSVVSIAALCGAEETARLAVGTAWTKGVVELTQRCTESFQHAVEVETQHRQAEATRRAAEEVLTLRRERAEKETRLAEAEAHRTALLQKKEEEAAALRREHAEKETRLAEALSAERARLLSKEMEAEAHRAALLHTKEEEAALRREHAEKETRLAEAEAHRTALLQKKEEEAAALRREHAEKETRLAEALSAERARLLSKEVECSSKASLLEQAQTELAGVEAERRRLHEATVAEVAQLRGALEAEQRRREAVEAEAAQRTATEQALRRQAEQEASTLHSELDTHRAQGAAMLADQHRILQEREATLVANLTAEHNAALHREATKIHESEHRLQQLTAALSAHQAQRGRDSLRLAESTQKEAQMAEQHSAAQLEATQLRKQISSLQRQSEEKEGERQAAMAALAETHRTEAESRERALAHSIAEQERCQREVERSVEVATGLKDEVRRREEACESERAAAERARAEQAALREERVLLEAKRRDADAQREALARKHELAASEVLHLREQLSAAESARHTELQKQHTEFMHITEQHHTEQKKEHSELRSLEDEVSNLREKLASAEDLRRDAQRQGDALLKQQAQRDAEQEAQQKATAQLEAQLNTLRMQAAASEAARGQTESHYASLLNTKERELLSQTTAINSLALNDSGFGGHTPTTTSSEDETPLEVVALQHRLADLAAYSRSEYETSALQQRADFSEKETLLQKRLAEQESRSAEEREYGEHIRKVLAAQNRHAEEELERQRARGVEEALLREEERGEEVRRRAVLEAELGVRVDGVVAGREALAREEGRLRRVVIEEAALERVRIAAQSLVAMERRGRAEVWGLHTTTHRTLLRNETAVRERTERGLLISSWVSAWPRLLLSWSEGAQRISLSARCRTTTLRLTSSFESTLRTAIEGEAMQRLHSISEKFLRFIANLTQADRAVRSVAYSETQSRAGAVMQEAEERQHIVAVCTAAISFDAQLRVASESRSLIDASITSSSSSSASTEGVVAVIDTLPDQSYENLYDEVLRDLTDITTENVDLQPKVRQRRQGLAISEAPLQDEEDEGEIRVSVVLPGELAEYPQYTKPESYGEQFAKRGSGVRGNIVRASSGPCKIKPKRAARDKKTTTAFTVPEGAKQMGEMWLGRLNETAGTGVFPASVATESTATSAQAYESQNDSDYSTSSSTEAVEGTHATRSAASTTSDDLTLSQTADGATTARRSLSSNTTAVFSPSGDILRDELRHRAKRAQPNPTRKARKEPSAPKRTTPRQSSEGVYVDVEKALMTQIHPKHGLAVLRRAVARASVEVEPVLPEDSLLSSSKKTRKPKGKGGGGGGGGKEASTAPLSLMSLPVREALVRDELVEQERARVRLILQAHSDAVIRSKIRSSDTLPETYAREVKGRYSVASAEDTSTANTPTSFWRQRVASFAIDSQ